MRGVGIIFSSAGDDDRDLYNPIDLVAYSSSGNAHKELVLEKPRRYWRELTKLSNYYEICDSIPVTLGVDVIVLQNHGWYVFLE